MASGLDVEQRQKLIEQFVDAYADEQKSYDTSVRTLAAAGVAVTVSLAAAFEDLTRGGEWAIFFFLASLGLNLASYQTSQRDLTLRIASLAAGRDDEYQGGGWKTATTLINLAAGLALVAGGVALALFVACPT